MWRLTVSTKPEVEYGYVLPAAAQFEGSEVQMYYYYYSSDLTLNNRYGSLGVL